MSGWPSSLTSAATALKPMARDGHPGLDRDVLEAAAPRRERRRFSSRICWPDRGEEDVGVAVVVEVEEKRGGAAGQKAQARLVGGVAEVPVAGIQEEVVAADRGHEEIQPAVAVDVARGRPPPDEAPVLRGAVGGQRGADPRGVRDLREQILRGHHRPHLGGGEARELPGPASRACAPSPRPARGATPRWPSWLRPRTKKATRAVPSAPGAAVGSGASSTARAESANWAPFTLKRASPISEKCSRSAGPLSRPPRRRERSRAVASPAGAAQLAVADPLELRGDRPRRRGQPGRRHRLREERGHGVQVPVADRDREREEVVGQRLGEVLDDLQPPGVHWAGAGPRAPGPGPRPAARAATAQDRPDGSREAKGMKS